MPDSSRCNIKVESEYGTMLLSDERLGYGDSVKFCEDNDAVLMPLTSSLMLQEATKKVLRECEKDDGTVTEISTVRVGLQLKHAQGVWSDGTRFSNEEEGSFIDYQKPNAESACQDVFLDLNQGLLKAKSSCKFVGNALCYMPPSALSMNSIVRFFRELPENPISLSCIIGLFIFVVLAVVPCVRSCIRKKRKRRARLNHAENDYEMTGVEYRTDVHDVDEASDEYPLPVSNVYQPNFSVRFGPTMQECTLQPPDAVYSPNYSVRGDPSAVGSVPGRYDTNGGMMYLPTYDEAADMSVAYDSERDVSDEEVVKKNPRNPSK